MATTTKKTTKKRAMSDDYKAKLAQGRTESRAVSRYLEAVVAGKGKRGRKRTPQSIASQIHRIDQEIIDAAPIKKLELIQKKSDLLAEKAMPEGGWRAVQVGSDTLVISFEDADVASDFGRRVASKGYSATSPVSTIGRYWNVSVSKAK